MNREQRYEYEVGIAARAFEEEMFKLGEDVFNSRLLTGGAMVICAMHDVPYEEAFELLRAKTIEVRDEHLAEAMRCIVGEEGPSMLDVRKDVNEKERLVDEAHRRIREIQLVIDRLCKME